MLKLPQSQVVYAIYRLMRPFMLRPPKFVVNHRSVLLGTLFCSLWLWMTGVPCTQAQSIVDRVAGSPKVPWQISADTVTYDAQSTTYHARGNVIIEKQAARMVADTVAFNHKAMTALATGHVVMTVGEDLITGERVELNLNQETGVVHGGSVFLKESHFFIRGDRIEKTGKLTYLAKKASITSCDGDDPDWIITGRTVKVTIEGYGTATHAVFKAGGIPVLYAPYLLFPAKTKRQTGLLIPEPSYSNRLGFAWDQPFFWAISDDTDATLYAHVMEKRGTKLGLEYRYTLTNDSYGAIMADGLKDNKVDDGTPENTKDWGYDDDDYDRPNQDRYWLRAKADQELPWGALARLDLDFVSDQDYLTEFRDGHSGYYATRDYFRGAFGRDLDTYDDDIRTNRLNVNKTWARYTLNGDLLWYDNVVKRRWEETDDTLQRLPQIRFDSTKQKAFGSAVYWDIDSEYTYFYQEDDDRGHRADVYPRVYLPLKWKNYLSIEPSAGWRQTAWVMDRWDDDTLDQTTYRQIYDFELDLSTEFSKVMGSPVSGVDRIRHSIKPQVVYEYIPDQDQSDLPDYDTTIDRIDEANEITYSLTNIFTAKKKRTTASPDTDNAAEDGKQRSNIKPGDRTAIAGDEVSGRSGVDQPELQTYDYNRFCRFYLEQTYDIAAAREDDSEPFSDVYGELEFNFGRYLQMDSDASYDTYETRFSSYGIGASLTDRRGDRLGVEHRYKTSKYESIRSALTVRLTEHLTARGEYERNLLDDVDIIRGAGFLYTAQCWSVDLFYSVEKGDDNKKLSILINLVGIGGFGE